MSEAAAMLCNHNVIFDIDRAAARSRSSRPESERRQA
jgi:hypothetical protein